MCLAAISSAAVGFTLSSHRTTATTEELVSRVTADEVLPPSSVGKGAGCALELHDEPFTLYLTRLTDSLLAVHSKPFAVYTHAPTSAPNTHAPSAPKPGDDDNYFVTDGDDNLINRASEGYEDDLYQLNTTVGLTYNYFDDDTVYPNNGCNYGDSGERQSQTRRFNTELLQHAHVGCECSQQACAWMQFLRVTIITTHVTHHVTRTSCYGRTRRSTTDDCAHNKGGS